MEDAEVFNDTGHAPRECFDPFLAVGGWADRDVGELADGAIVVVDRDGHVVGRFDGGCRGKDTCRPAAGQKRKKIEDLIEGRYKKLRSIGAKCITAEHLKPEKPTIPERLSAKAQLEKAAAEQQSVQETTKSHIN